MKDVTQTFYRVLFQATPPLLWGQVLRPLTVLELTQATELLLAEAQRYNCAFWLLDGRADITRDQPELYHWLEEAYLPRVREVLGRPPIVALLAMPEFWQQLQTTSHISVPAPLSGAFRLEWFTEIEAAKSWLAQFRRLDGAPR